MKRFTQAAVVSGVAVAALLGSSTAASAATWESSTVYFDPTPNRAHAQCVAKGKQMVKLPHVYAYRCDRSPQTPTYSSTLWLLIN